MVTIGLFGTCGNSLWRKNFIEKYESLNINYFNPQVSNWNPEFAKNEALHLAKDQIILFPVTNETYGLGSLSEIGFSILNAIKLNKSRSLIVYISDELNTNLENDILFHESIKQRSLIKAHLNELELSNIYMVNNLNEMLKVSLVLYDIEILKQKIEKYSVNKKRG